jgi:DNA-binding beta-propeller fold protein YncE
LPDGTRAYVTNQNDNTVSVNRYGQQYGPFGVAVTPDGKHAYVTYNTVWCTAGVGGAVAVKHGGGHGPGGDFPLSGCHHPRWVTCLCGE